MTDPTTAPDQQVDPVLDRIVGGFASLRRSPVLHTPAEHGLAFEEVTFPARDGVPLEGWFIPAPGARAVVIANHPMGFTRSGMPTHLEPWHSAWAASGNGFEVDLTPDYRILHDAGYHVLAYDLRNHGLSGAANGGIASSGIFEARDVAGSLDHVRSRVGDLPIGLFSRCLGASSTFSAAARFPDAFDGVRCLVGAQPVTAKVILGRRIAAAGLDDHIDELDRRLRVATGIGFAERAPREWAEHVTVPSYLYGVRDDVLTEPEDLQAMHENLPVRDKALHWIPDTTVRWDGYLEFQRRPRPMLEWFARYLS